MIIVISALATPAVLCAALAVFWPRVSASSFDEGEIRALHAAFPAMGEFNGEQQMRQPPQHSSATHMAIQELNMNTPSVFDADLKKMQQLIEKAKKEIAAK